DRESLTRQEAVRFTSDGEDPAARRLEAGAFPARQGCAVVAGPPPGRCDLCAVSDAAEWPAGRARESGELAGSRHKVSLGRNITRVFPIRQPVAGLPCRIS